MECLGQLSGLLAQEPDVFNIIIVDSIIVRKGACSCSSRKSACSRERPGTVYSCNQRCASALWLPREFGSLTPQIRNSTHRQATFRTDYCGRGELAERQQTLNQAIGIFRRMAEEWNIGIVFTNQMSANPAGGMTFVSDPKQPVGGHILAHGVQARIYLKKGGGETRIAKVWHADDCLTAACSTSA